MTFLVGGPLGGTKSARRPPFLAGTRGANWLKSHSQLAQRLRHGCGSWGGDWVGWAVLSRQETPEFLSKPIGNSGVSFFTGGGSIGSGYGRTIKLFINAIKLIV